MKRALGLSCLIAVCIFVAGCSIPVMHLMHTSSVETAYPTIGSIKIIQFEDKRPEEEKVKGKTARNTLSGQVWSGETNPEMLLFFQQTLEEEAGNTGLFADDGQDVYELSGKVMSMKVDRKVTVMRYLGIIPLTAGILASGEGETGLIWLGLLGSLVIQSLDFPQLKATVHFQAVLTRNGTVVFEKEIQVTEKKRYWSMTETSWPAVSKKAGSLLDIAVTESIANLFEEIGSEFNEGNQ